MLKRVFPVLLLFAFAFGIVSAVVVSVDLNSPAEGVTYSDPNVLLNITFSNNDLGRILYSLNNASNESVGYSVTYDGVIGTSPGNVAVTGLYVDNSDRLFVALASGTIGVFNAADFSLITTLPGDGTGFLSVYGDDQFIYASTEGGEIRIWDPDVSIDPQVIITEGLGGPMNRVNVDDNYIYAASSYGIIYVYNKTDFSPIVNLTDGASDIGGEVLDVYSDNQYIYGANNDSNVYVWDINTFNLVATLTDSTVGLSAVRSSEDYIQAAGADRKVYIWNKNDFSLNNDNCDSGFASQFDKDGDNIWIANSFGAVFVCNVDGSFVEFATGNFTIGASLAVYSTNEFIYSGTEQGFIERRIKTYDETLLPALNGSNTLDLSVYDNRENLAVNSSTFTVITPQPEITILEPVEGFVYNHSLRVLQWFHNIPAVSWGGYSLNGALNMTFHSLFPPNLVQNLPSDNETWDIESDDDYFYTIDRVGSRVKVYNKTDLNFVAGLEDGEADFSLTVEEHGNFVYEGGFNCKINVFNKNNWSLAFSLDEGDEGINCGFFSLHQDGEKLYAGQELNEDGGRVFIWNLTSHELLGNYSTIGIPFAIDTDEDYLYVADRAGMEDFTGTIRRINKTDFTLKNIYTSQETGNIRDLKVDEINIYVAKRGTFGTDEFIYVFNKQNGSIRKIHSKSDVFGIYIDPDFIYSSGSSLGFEDYNLRIWDKDNLNLLHEVEVPGLVAPIRAVFSDSDYLYIGTGGPGIGSTHIYNSINPIKQFKAREGLNIITLYMNDTFGKSSSTTVNFEVDTELLFSPKMIDNDHANFLFKFTLLNNHLGSGNFNWTIDFGDGFILDSSEDVFLEDNEDVVVFAGHSYASPGPYTITSYASNGTVSDSKSGMVNTI